MPLSSLDFCAGPFFWNSVLLQLVIVKLGGQKLIQSKAGSLPPLLASYCCLSSLWCESETRGETEKYGIGTLVYVGICPNWITWTRICQQQIWLNPSKWKWTLQISIFYSPNFLMTSVPWLALLEESNQSLVFRSPKEGGVCWAFRWGFFGLFAGIFSYDSSLCWKWSSGKSKEQHSSREASRGGVLSGVEDLPSFLGILQSWTISCCFPLTMCVLKSLKSKRNFSLKIVTTFSYNLCSIAPHKVRLG